jgi:hypothetical protein
LCWNPIETWDGKAGSQFIINGLSDSEYAKGDSRHSINGWSTWLFGCCVTHQSKMMPIIALSIAEAEFVCCCIVCTGYVIYHAATV